MKKLSILSLLFIGLLAFNSCETEDDVVFVTQDSNGPVVTLPANGSDIVLDINNQMSTAATIVWDEADYNVPTAVNYTIQLAVSGTDFATPADAGATTENYYVWSNSQLNDVAVGNLLLTPFLASNVDLRVKATIGDGGETTYSNIVTLSITPYTTDLPRLAVPGNHQGWQPDESIADYVPYLASSAFGATDYEGFVYLDGEFKFVEPNNVGVFEWNNKDWGDDGSFSGSLISDGEVNLSATAGYYYVQVNTDPNDDGSEPGSYNIQATEWGVIGNATPTGWDSDTDMIYDANTKTWSVTLDLIPQAAPDNGLKFRANDGWDLNIGDNDADGTMEFGGQNIGVETAGTYLITLDLSNPRLYTYSIELQ